MKEIDFTKRLGKTLIKHSVKSKSKSALMDLFDLGIDALRNTMNDVSEVDVHLESKVDSPVVKVKTEKAVEVKNCITCEFKTKLDVLLEGQLWCLEHGEVVETNGCNGCGCNAWKKNIKENF